MRFGNQLALLALLVGVLAPTACVLWFMNVAIENQRGADRQKLTEAYRGQLTLLRDRADAYWQNRAGALERETREGTAPEIFARLVEKGGADSAVVLNADASLGYPTVAMSTAAGLPDLASDPRRAEWMAAQALESVGNFTAAAEAYAGIAKSEANESLLALAVQARVRCLLRSGDKKGALDLVEQSFGTGPLAQVTGPDGRLIAGDEQLLSIRLLGTGDGRYAAAIARLRALIGDYSSPMPAAQRLFLMEETGAAAFPTYTAEQLAAKFVESGRAQPGGASLETSGVADVWKLTLPGARAITLYRTETVVAAMAELSKGLEASVTLTPPGLAAPAAAEWMPAGSSLPGWQMSLSPAAGQPDGIARRRVSYLWIGLAAIAVVALTALLVGQAIRRQWRLARLKTDLVAAVSHELKTPLSSMRVLVESLLDDKEATAQKTHEYLEMIARENLRLSRLIENFLTFARLERNRRKFEFSLTQPDRVAQAALAATQERFRNPECRVEVSIPHGLPALRADEDALVTVLLNLLDNAYKYTPAEKRIALKVFERAGSVVFAVEDNGIGIAPREQRRIFRRFYQVDHRLARESSGCGLGLSIVESIVKTHGGKVEVVSRPGQGSTFSVALPSANSMRVSAIRGAA